jgi:hypothetical protein
MADSEFELTAPLTRAVAPAIDRLEQSDAQSTSAVDRNPTDGVTCRAGDSSCATAHASTLNRATAAHPARAGRSLLQLQKQYGNRYVKRVVALARDTAAHEEASANVEQAISRERGGGQPLDSGVRRHMESALSADFGGVRVHTDNQAHTLNRELSARAFTTGQDIFFRKGAYEPGTSQGRELIAHELTHVVQQDGATVSRQFSVSQPGDAHEVEAEQTARAIIQQENQPGIARQDDEKQEEMPISAGSDLQRQPELSNDDQEKNPA